MKKTGNNSNKIAAIFCSVCAIIDASIGRFTLSSVVLVAVGVLLAIDELRK